MILAALLFPALIFFTPELRAEGDVQRGEIIAKVRCYVCHHFHYAAAKSGPSLMSIYNRPPSIRNVPFERWDDVSLSQWLENPRRVKINTTMVFSGLSREKDRRDVIAYLKTL